MKIRSIAYLRGYNAGRFGANNSNCSYVTFSTALEKHDWQMGYRAGRLKKWRIEKKRKGKITHL